ncbi:response regulator transcription factor [Paenibacillus luteus]|uniref:response regulator transcription factor n=1 Tax=Paenibacillus luteus TaxID=2545753 RepID=UPI00137571CE|nr:response regulator [Paenibacillus luteus]
MVVEDEPWIRSSIVQMVNLIDGDFVIASEARNGEEAWTLIQELWPIILITDIMMPTMDGLTLIEKIVEHNIPMTFIVVSGFDNFQYAQKAMHYDVSEYLLKPVDMNQLHNALKRSVQQIGHISSMNELLLRFQKLLDGMDPMDTPTLFKKMSGLIESVLRLTFINESAKFNLLRIFEQKLCSLINEESSDAALVGLNKSMSDLTIRQHFQTLTEKWMIRRHHEEKTNQNYIMKKACEYIHIHYMKDISLTEMAEFTCMSISHFSLWFKRYTGKTLVNYIHETRINKAKDLLRETRLKVYEIAEQVGFTTQPYFIRVFKNTMGLSPNEYRRSLGL